MAFSDADTCTYQVLVNGEEQYSLWPCDLEIPNGWRAVGFEGSQGECSAYVDEVWKDMRPLSLRRAQAGEAPPIAADQ
jgi:MbtH protein